MKPPLVVLTAGVAASLSACGSAASVEHATHSFGAPSRDISTVLQTTWQSYARTFITADGRVVDPHIGGNTTSEGQSYALLRAVWMDDRSTFDRVWTWTQMHLWQPEQRFAWLWNASGHVQDRSSATDADEDIALALLFAANRWHDSTYRSAALPVITGIWSEDVATVNGVPYLTAGNWAPQGDPAGPVLDPSYFAPYAYRIFAAADSSHDWAALVRSSYRVLTSCSQTALGGTPATGLPPDWCVLDRNAGTVRPYSARSGGDDYGYDAFRVMWRTALDAVWNDSPDALSYLGSQSFLRSEWQRRGALAAVYHHDGTPTTTYDDPTVYGGDIGAFIGDPGAAQGILTDKLLASLHEAGGVAYFGTADNYYEQNWVWFGLALGAGQLPDLAAG
ncbi:MAG: hypothetical protein JOY68_04720 [Candidatus Dormibacteraeota bacterium]|nr:hypothetical protein [Candidatus Dormibacteraeota bacterium]